MKKNIILGILISIVVTKMFSLYNWVIAERKKYRSKSPSSKTQEPKNTKKKCINYPTNTAPDSFYEGVEDTSTLTLISNTLQGLLLIGLTVMYFF